MVAAHVPTTDTRYLVRKMTEQGYAQPKIMERIGLKHDQTFRKHYREEITASIVDRHLAVAETLYSIATDRDHPKCISAAIFIAKTQMGWIDQTRLVIEGQVNHTHTVDFDAAALSADQRSTLREILLAGQTKLLPPPEGSAVEDGEFTEVDGSPDYPPSSEPPDYGSEYEYED